MKQQQCAFCNNDLGEKYFRFKLAHERTFHNYEKLPDLCGEECIEKYCNSVKENYVQLPFGSISYPKKVSLVLSIKAFIASTTGRWTK